MAYRFDIPRGSTQSALMSAEYCGASILVRYFDGAGVEIQPAAEGQISISTTVSLEDFTAVNPAGRGMWLINGPILRVRLSITGTGAASASAEIWRYGVPMDLSPNGLYSGLRAATAQNYTEANVKAGRQYEISSLTAALGVGANIDTIFTTGASPVLIKSRIVQFNGTSLAVRVYRAPTYTGGTIVPYFNLNDRNPVAGSVVIRTGVLVSAPGVEFGAPTFDVGSEGQGNSSLGTYVNPGIERLLDDNTTYLQRITNDSAAVQRVSSYLSWYEGGTDLPLRQ